MKRALMLAALLVSGCKVHGDNGFVAPHTTGGGTTPAGSSPPPSSGPPVQNALPGGIFTGTLSSSNSSTDTVIAIVTDAGEARLIDVSTGKFFLLQLNTQGNTASGSFTGYAPPGMTFSGAGQTETGTVDVTIQSRSQISGTYATQANAVNGSISLKYSAADYERGSSLTSLPGTFAGTVGGVALTLTIQNDGSYSGADGSGCNFTGNFSIIDSRFNAYRQTFNSACPGRGSHSDTGLAYLTPASGSGASITFAVSDSSSFVALTVQKQ
ncbi:MAG: hypothetical protein ACRETW_11680 [Stenotrophobium sp.]